MRGNERSGITWLCLDQVQLGRGSSAHKREKADDGRTNGEGEDE
jgi:hypothetical protein